MTSSDTKRARTRVCSVPVWKLRNTEPTSPGPEAARPGAGAPAMDPVAVEEPLEIRVAGETLAITMRTPGDDAALALGLLRSEGIVSDARDVSRIAHCGRTDQSSFGNVIDVSPGPGVSLSLDDFEHSRRGTLTSSACGVCGRTRIDDLERRLQPIRAAGKLPASVVIDAPTRLREAQHGFLLTGGFHAAAAFDARGRLLTMAEDVGRHNAVDKVVGRLLLDGLRPPLTDPLLLVVSGRSSFEIVQKALSVGFVAIAGISAPSSLAVRLAETFGLSLAGFVRDGGLNLYTHPDRIDWNA